VIVDDVWLDVSDEAKGLISKMLVSPEEKRLSAKQASEHPWLKEQVKHVVNKETMHKVLDNIKKFQVIICLSVG
jgi:ribosomal protein S1